MQISRSIDLELTDAARNVESDGEVVEISLLLPRWQASELEQEAYQRGLTTGQMVRHLLGDFFERTERG